jgi:hypothetical protein
LEPNVNSQNETVFSVEFCREYHGYWSRPKATFVFFIAEKIFEFGSVKKMEKYQISVVWASLQRAH